MLNPFKDIAILYIRTDKRLKEFLREQEYRVKLEKRVHMLEHELRCLKNSKRCHH